MKVTPDQKTLFVSGVDPKVVAFKFIEPDHSNTTGQWVKGDIMQRHTHDVRAIEIAGKYLISAG